MGRGTIALIVFLCWSSNDVIAFGSSFSLLYSWMDILSTVVQEEEMLLPISDRTGTADKEDPSIRLTISPLDRVMSNNHSSHSCVQAMRASVRWWRVHTAHCLTLLAEDSSLFYHDVVSSNMTQLDLR